MSAVIDYRYSYSYSYSYSKQTYLGCGFRSH